MRGQLNGISKGTTNIIAKTANGLVETKCKVNVIEIQEDAYIEFDDTLTIDNVYERLEEEFGETNYGKVKYSSEVLYWIGYLIVIAYTMIYHQNKYIKLLSLKN